MTAAAPRRAPAPARSREAGRAHLRVAASPPRGRRRLGFWLGTGLSVAAVFLLVAFHVFAVQHAFEIDRLAQEREREEQRYERLRRDVATRTSPEAIVTAAGELGMVVASRVETFDEPESPAPAASGPPADEAASTLAQSWDDAKGSLGP